MDNENIRIEFVNGSSITSRYAEAPVFHHVDIRDSNLTEFRRGEWPTVIGYRPDNLVYDEFVGIDQLGDYSKPLVDMFNSVQTGYTISPNEVQGRFNKWWYEVGQHEFSIDGDKIIIRQKEAPDFGEITPTQELKNYINELL